MSQDREDDSITGTALDPKLARPRLKESLVPPDTGIFLRVVNGNDRGQLITLSSGGTYLLGREGADIALEDEKISRKHAEISLLGPDAFFLRDLASTNGTFLNGKRVTDKRPLRHEDRIRVGDTVILFAVIQNSIPVPSR
jgi:pSer/pThr/pTyr-binding forkhead associated (FHA) protein